MTGVAGRLAALTCALLVAAPACDFFAARHFRPTRSTADDPSPLKSFCPPDGTGGLRRAWIDVQRDSIIARYSSGDSLRRYDVVLARAGLTPSHAGRIAESPDVLAGFRMLDEPARAQSSLLVRGWIVRVTSYASASSERRALLAAADLPGLSNWDLTGAPWRVEPSGPDASAPAPDGGPSRDDGFAQ